MNSISSTAPSHWIMVTSSTNIWRFACPYLKELCKKCVPVSQLFSQGTDVPWLLVQCSVHHLPWTLLKNNWIPENRTCLLRKQILCIVCTRNGRFLRGRNLIVHMMFLNVIELCPRAAQNGAASAQAVFGASQGFSAFPKELLFRYCTVRWWLSWW